MLGGTSVDVSGGFKMQTIQLQVEVKADRSLVNHCGCGALANRTLSSVTTTKLFGSRSR